MKRQWYVSWFNTEDYLDLYRHRDEHDAKKILQLILKHIRLKKDAEILDLACGAGRHSILFAKKGFRVTGIDLSKYLISLAKKKLNGEYRKYRDRLKFEIKDMKHFSKPGKFELAVNLFTSFGYFESNKDNESVIKCVAESLKKGGYFVLDFLNKEYLMRNLRAYSIDKEKKKILIQTRDISGNFVNKNILIVNKQNSHYVFKTFNERIRLYSLRGFKKMFRKHRLKLFKLFGDYEGNAYDEKTSPRLILISQRV